MKPPKPVFSCQQCGSQSPKWLGRCPDCNAWNSFVEEIATPVESRGAAPALGGGKAHLYTDVDTVVADRLGTGISEFDRVLGGGIVPGSLVLLGGEPGIGKSTLLLQAAAHFASNVGPVLYCSGEESEHQIKLRGERLGVGRVPLYLLAETCVERLMDEVSRVKPALLIVDSIQTVFSLLGRFDRLPQTSCLRQKDGRCRRFWSVTSRKMAASPARRCSSTSWTRCCTSKAGSSTRIASCAP